MGSCLKSKAQSVSVVQENQGKKTKSPEEKGLSLIIKCWKQTNNSLFNYKLPDSTLKTQVINIMLRKVRFIKLGGQYQALFPTDPQFSKVMPPVMVDINQLKDKDKFGQNRYTFVINEFPKISKPFWLVVKSLPSQKYHLKQGDIFKMGKIKIRVKQIVDKNSQTKDMNKQIVEAEYKVYTLQGNVCEGQVQDSDLKCRICMQEGQRSNPLLAVCDCIGSSKYAHFKCLRQWFTTQLDPAKINMVTEINWKSLQCQLCKANLPYSIRLDNDDYFLVEFPKIKKPYLVLNPVYKSNNQKSRIYYFISFKKRNRMVVGRKSDADIQFCTDATISRHHSTIQYVQKGQDEGGRFYLEDNGSRFGTVVLLNTKSAINVEAQLNGVQFQVGGDVIKISYKTQNYFQTLSTKGDQIDFNATSTEIGTQQFRQEEDEQVNMQKINQVASSSQSQNKTSAKPLYNHQMISSFEQHDNTTDALQIIRVNPQRDSPKKRKA